MLRYEKVRSTGFDQIPSAPEHWEVNRLGPLLKHVSVKNRPDMPLLSITREEGVIERNVDDDSENHNYIPDDLSGYKVLQKGQFGMNKMKAWQGSYGVSRHNGIVSPAYYVFDFTKPIDPKFFHWAIRNKRYISFFGEASDGVRIGQWDLSKERMKRIPFLTPPIEEQTAIANFLDRKTALIDRAIAQKERLIELLRERRQILIQRAVTRGLDPEVELKDSGVEWIGLVPAHWEVKRLKTFVQVQTGITLGKRYVTSNLNSIPYLRVANVQAGYFDLDDVAYLELPENEVSKYALKSGDLLVTEGGDIDKLGRGAVWKSQVKNCIHQNHVFAIRIKDSSIQSEFVSIAFGSSYGRYYFTHTANKTTNLASTNSTKLGNFPIALPPSNEMLEIMDWLKAIEKNTDITIETLTAQIDKLKEYRATLIDAAVTGKIKVN